MSKEQKVISIKQILTRGLLAIALATSSVVALDQLRLGGNPVKAQEEYKAYLPLVEKGPILRQPDISQISLPEIISQIPPFPSDISITNPGYWPYISWGEYESTEPGMNVHSWRGTFEGLRGIDDQGQVHLLVDLDVGEGQNLREAVLPTDSLPTVFIVGRLQQGQSEIYQTTDPEEVYAVIAQPNWFRPNKDEPILIYILRDFIKQDTPVPPQIRIIASRISSQSW